MYTRTLVEAEGLVCRLLAGGYSRISVNFIL